VNKEIQTTFNDPRIFKTIDPEASNEAEGTELSASVKLEAF